MLQKHNVKNWIDENKNSFEPPVCNKLMYKHQLSIMFVGAPNTRTDFHIEEGSEFFYQLRGDMELITVQQGKRKLVKIHEGEVFLVPSRIPHSPQRPKVGSVGLVVERCRTQDERDCMRWYTNIDVCDQVLWQKYFYCDDLGRDLVPVVKAFKETQAFQTGVPDPTVLAAPAQIVPDIKTVVPDSFPLKEFLNQNKDKLLQGQTLPLFPGHPDKEFLILICGGGENGTKEEAKGSVLEQWFYQLEGTAEVIIVQEGSTSTTVLHEGECGIVPAGSKFSVIRRPHSIGLTLTQDPKGNKHNS